MRIALVLSGLGAGGAERVAAILARAWIDRGWDVVLVCFEQEGTEPYHRLPEEVRIIRRPPPRKRSFHRAALDLAGRVLFLRRIFRSENPDVVVSFLTKNNVLALLANMGSSRPLVICERNNPLRQDVRPTWHAIQGRLARRSTLVLQTSASRRAFSSAALAGARVIPNPIERAWFAANPLLNTIVAAGRLVEQKGFDRLIDAFAQALPSSPGWNLVIWGEGPMRGALEAQRHALGLDDKVALPGISAVPREWVCSGSVFALSSRYEGFPNVLVEAMSAGMAVVSFDCPFGPADIVRNGEDGLLVPEGDVPALAGCLSRLMVDPPLRLGLGRAAQHSVQRFGVDRVIAEWDAALETALAGRRGRGNSQGLAAADGRTG